MTINIYSSTLETLAKALEGIPFPSATFIVENAALKLLAVANLEKDIDQDEWPTTIDVKPEQIQDKLLARSHTRFVGEFPGKIISDARESVLVKRGRKDIQCFE